VHKTLGLFALLHFLYRFAYVGAADMRFDTSRTTVVCLLAHALLSATSLVFRIPLKRITEGSRIWPEYRLHSIIFAYRSLACMAITYTEMKLGITQPFYAANGLVVMATLFAADFGSWYVGPAGRSSTIQDLDAPPPMRFFFSVMQFHATVGCLLGVRRFATQFIYVWIIQFTAFLMTLRRKNVAPHGPLVATYGVMLTAGAMVSAYDHASAGCFLMHNVLAHTAVVLRMQFRLSKYVLWAAFAVAVPLARPYLVLTEQSALAPSIAAWVLSTAAVGAIGVKKVRATYAREAAEASKAIKAQ